MTMFIPSVREGEMFSTPLDELKAYGGGTTSASVLLRRKIETEAATVTEVARDGSVGNAGPNKKLGEPQWARARPRPWENVAAVRSGRTLLKSHSKRRTWPLEA